MEVRAGIITRLVPATELGFASNTYRESQNGPDLPCSVPDNAPHPTNPGIAGASGRHDTNVDVDHGANGAIVVQMMPYGTTPNPGGVYKAWVSTLDAYRAKGGDLSAVPRGVRGRDAQPCPDFCANADPGFGPPRNLQKTDNFKVREEARLRVVKVNDRNGNGARDAGEPTLEGWAVAFIERLGDGSESIMTDQTTATRTFVPGDQVTVCEAGRSGWTFSFATVNGSAAGSVSDRTIDGTAYKCVPVTVGAAGATVEIAFGNYQFGEKSGYKFHDRDADGAWSQPAEPGLAGWTITLTGTNGRGQAVSRSAVTDANGHYRFDNLAPGSYTAAESCAGQVDWFQSYPTSATPCGGGVHAFSITSGDPGSPDVHANNNFGNYQKGRIRGRKLYDIDGNGTGESALSGWVIHLLSASGAKLAEANTGADGGYAFSDLMPGTYLVCEVQQSRWFQTSPPSGAGSTINCSAYNTANGVTYGEVGYSVSLLSGDAASVGSDKDFCNTTGCDGLSPGFWGNWRNHYTSAQFLVLLQGTIAEGASPEASIALADAYLTSTGCDGGDALGCMRRMLLADQLTVRLTQQVAAQPSFPNPSGGNLKLVCRTAGVSGSLQDVFAQAIAIHAANGSGYSRDQILAVKNALAAFITK
jgi:hypothetical protein